MRRHLRWIILLVSVPVSYVLLMLLARSLADAARQSGQAGGISGGVSGWAWLQLAVLLAALVVPLVLLIRAIVHMRRTYRRAQRRKGRFTKGEQIMLDRGRQVSDAWERAGATRSLLSAGQIPQGIQQWEVVPYPGEVFFARVSLTYARYYGRDVAYSQSSAVALGRPGFVVGALAVTAISNIAARSRAASISAPQWREWQLSTVYLTDRRIVTFAGGRWLSFHYEGMTALYPELPSATFVCQFQDTEPLLLSGDDAALAAVFAVWQTHGIDALRGHPALAPLDGPVPLPDLPPVGKQG